MSEISAGFHGMQAMVGEPRQQQKRKLLFSPIFSFLCEIKGRLYSSDSARSSCSSLNNLMESIYIGI